MHTYRRCFYFWYFFFAVSFDILWYGYICWNHSIAVNALNTHSSYTYIHTFYEYEPIQTLLTFVYRFKMILFEVFGYQRNLSLHTSNTVQTTSTSSNSHILHGRFWIRWSDLFIVNLLFGQFSSNLHRWHSHYDLLHNFVPFILSCSMMKIRFSVEFSVNFLQFWKSQ